MVVTEPGPSVPVLVGGGGSGSPWIFFITSVESANTLSMLSVHCREIRSRAA